jgi:hypothetical protein
VLRRCHLRKICPREPADIAMPDPARPDLEQGRSESTSEHWRDAAQQQDAEECGQASEHQGFWHGRDLPEQNDREREEADPADRREHELADHADG